ncbi:alpha/beta hydrolase [Xylanimonas oleitrophica]|uniref:Alpha/beta hydrolase n=1 Tax=Xylanimonas oleitrophica TaxID=2607479 RepID=A0A2W5Y7B1_9MICO|nr:alpha/beta hydrolase [Xylanimonas oleitrophica]PZR54234.1 alpha/beta hydrolase [Xylanimonas oleitrophica]
MADFTLLTHDGDPDRVATILPGQGYTADGPLLAYAAAVLRDAGWSLRTFVWDSGPSGRDEARETYTRVVREGLDAAPHAKHLVVGKSLGTLALPVCSLLSVPGVWITPLVSDQGTVDVRDAALTLHVSGLPTVLAGGSDDPLWDPVVAAKSGARVVEVAHADHSLMVPGDWRASLAALGEVTAAVAELAEQVAGS